MPCMVTKGAADCQLVMTINACDSDKKFQLDRRHGRRHSTSIATKPLNTMTMTATTDSRVLWIKVGEIFQSGHARCADCDYCATSSTDVPYGEGWTDIEHADCVLSDDPKNCPVLIEWMDDEDKYNRLDDLSNAAFDGADSVIASLK